MQQRSQNGTATSSGFFSTSFFSSNKSSHDLNAASTTATTSKSTSTSRSRPGTSSGDTPFGSGGGSPTRPTTRGGEEGRERNVLTKVRKASFSSPSKHRRHASSGGVSLGGVSGPFVTDNSVPPALPDFAIAAAAKVSNNGYNNDIAPSRSPVTGDFGGIGMSRMPSRGNLGPSGGGGPGSVSSSQAMQVPNQTSDSAATAVHAHISETASKRISTLDYLRKAHEGRLYWFNTLLFDKPDMLRMPYFDSRKLARRATNYLLLGLSLPTIIDLYSSTPVEFLRSFNTLLAEFDAFQQLHGENGTTGSLTRARLPQMFRRVPGAGGIVGAASGRSRRQSSAVSDSNGVYDGGAIPVAGSSGIGPGGGVPQQSLGAATGSVINFATGSETPELLPGEEYTHLLTPSLPFDPDFFETFATLCDVLIDAYTRLISLLPTPRECSGPVAELFSKADSKVRKIIIQGVVKEFDESTRAGAKTEVANIGKVVLGGLL